MYGIYEKVKGIYRRTNLLEGDRALQIIRLEKIQVKCKVNTRPRSSAGHDFTNRQFQR